MHVIQARMHVIQVCADMHACLCIHLCMCAYTWRPAVVVTSSQRLVSCLFPAESVVGCISTVIMSPRAPAFPSAWKCCGFTPSLWLVAPTYAACLDAVWGTVCNHTARGGERDDYVLTEVCLFACSSSFMMAASWQMIPSCGNWRTCSWSSPIGAMNLKLYPVSIFFDSVLSGDSSAVRWFLKAGTLLTQKNHTQPCTLHRKKAILRLFACCWKLVQTGTP